MAITAANLAAAHDTTNRTSTAYSTASISFVAGRVYMLAVRARVASGTPGVGSIAGGGNTWTLLQTSNISNVALWLYYCVAASTTSDTIDITPDGVTTWTQAGWIVDEFTNAAAVAQSAQNSNPSTHTSLTVTLPGFFYPATSVAYGAFAHNEDTALTAGSGFTDLGASTEASENANRMKSIYKSGEDTGVDITSASTASDVFGVAAEISESAPNFPEVEDVTASYFSAATAHAVNMPASVTAGQLLFVVLGIDASAAVTTPSGWTVVEDSAYRLRSYAKIADGTEGGTTVDFATGSNREMAAHVYRISNWYGTIATGVFAGTPNSGSASNPNTPLLDPGLGVAKEFLWIAVAGHTTSGATINSAPTNYIGYTETNDPPGSNDVALASAYRQMYEETEAPGTFAGTTSKGYSANTFAILVADPSTTVDLDGDGIASTESVPSPVLKSGISVTAIDSEEAFGTATMRMNVTAEAIASAEAVGEPTVSPIQAVTPGGIISEEAVGTPAVTPGDYTISPDGIASAEAIGDQVIGRAVFAESIASLEAFGAPAITKYITFDGIASEEAIGTHQLNRSIILPGIASAEAIGTTVITVGSVTITVSGIGSVEDFGDHLVTAATTSGFRRPPPGSARYRPAPMAGVARVAPRPPAGAGY